ncbi:hypothetical protein SSABA_v1c04900 [Spiroplasma sabaudiense Ar-1343]|uniref:Uncharacterized protein n=1 Tax=Spiroplasma sabaudiense Ar-1343 TaxID=1276257 RepID=W6AA16_9MOLU|nr:exodeoxyribonuclease VII small subunit [Spiroplasma sabaudiense]AHI53897.1 hypothetical protein SSABA_v1c04900 [Spiroplasma sabaudiense Ar-1343]
MASNDKNFDELLKEIKENIDKLDSPQIAMDEAVEIFKKSLESITAAKSKLDVIKGEVKKVIADNKIIDFEN